MFSCMIHSDRPRAVNLVNEMHLSMLSCCGGRPGIGGGFDSSHRPVVGTFDRFNGLSSNILLTFSCYFDNPQCPGVGHLNGNSQLSSNAPPMPGLPPTPPPPRRRLNIDRCISSYSAVHWCWFMFLGCLQESSILTQLGCLLLSCIQVPYFSTALLWL